MIDSITSLEELARFLGFSLFEMKHMNPESSYRSFQKPKPESDEKRLIEFPAGRLKDLLDILANALQWLYREHKTDAAYGYVRSSGHDPDKRNILTHATRHLGCNYLFNVDFDNFFYQVDTEKVNDIFRDKEMFLFYPETEDFLTKIVTLHKRLPMGSPTSPVLSNFATINLDLELLDYTRNNQITYTRYVDDLSFSSMKPINEKHYDQIQGIIKSNKFVTDPLKIKWFGQDEPKEITGLLVTDKISIPEPFMDMLDEDMNKFVQTREYFHQYPDCHVFEWLNKLKQMIHGRLAFVMAIYGKQHPVYMKLENKFRDIEMHDFQEISVSWRYAGYEYF